MKILVVTNLYPPHYVGGYELGCRDVVEKLRARGHTMHVVTGDFRRDEIPFPPNEDHVERILQYNGGTKRSPHSHLPQCSKFNSVLKKFSPDIIYFWNQSGLCPWLPVAARWQGFRMAFFLSDPVFISWRIGAWLAKAARKNSFIRAVMGKTFLVRGWPVIQNRPCHFASEFLKKVAESNEIRIAEKNSMVAHWGIEPAQFTVASPRVRWPISRLLYVGQMIPQKGVHTAIAAFALLTKEKGFEDLTLSLVGGGQNPEYEKQLRAQAKQLGVADRVHFLGMILRSKVPLVYSENDVLIFPSEWDEPFAITPLEASAGGLAIVGSTTGGSGELLHNRETAMTFKAGDSVDCARAIRELCLDRELFEKIRTNAAREILENHRLDGMVDKIEKGLREISSPAN